MIDNNRWLLFFFLLFLAVMRDLYYVSIFNSFFFNTPFPSFSLFLFFSFFLFFFFFFFSFFFFFFLSSFFFFFFTLFLPLSFSSFLFLFLFSLFLSLSLSLPFLPLFSFCRNGLLDWK